MAWFGRLGMRGLALTAAMGLGASGAGGAVSCAADAMLVFDGSASMSQRGGPDMANPRIIDARAAIARAMPLIAPFRRVGLIVYGPNGTPGDGPGPTAATSVGCRSVDVRFGPEAGSGPRIVSEIADIDPGGSTPLTEAVARGAAELDFRVEPGVVVLVTDGRETCGGKPCALADALAREGADLTVHVIGFRVRAVFFDWESGAGADGQEVPVAARCLPDRTGGTYTTTESVDDLADALYATLGCPVIGRAGEMGEITHPT